MRNIGRNNIALPGTGHFCDDPGGIVKPDPFVLPQPAADLLRVRISMDHRGQCPVQRNMIQLPDELAKNWYTRQYYGTVAHNSKAVYQKYMGWYDANPIHLGELEPTERAKKFVEYLGDVD